MNGSEIAAGQGSTVRTQTILLVEDEFVIRLMLGDALRDAGYHVLEAGDGAEGLAVLLSGQPIDLMVTDVRMPGDIDGIELSRGSKASDASRPVIVWSGHLLPEEADPADAFVSKPYLAQQLIDIIERLIGKPCPDQSQTRTA